MSGLLISNFKGTLGHFLGNFGATLGNCWGNFVSFLGICWGNLGVTWGQLKIAAAGPQSGAPRTPRTISAPAAATRWAPSVQCASAERVAMDSTARLWKTPAGRPDDFARSWGSRRHPETTTHPSTAAFRAARSANAYWCVSGELHGLTTAPPPVKGQAMPAPWKVLVQVATADVSHWQMAGRSNAATPLKISYMVVTLSVDHFDTSALKRVAPSNVLRSVVAAPVLQVASLVPMVPPVNVKIVPSENV